LLQPPEDDWRSRRRTITVHFWVALPAPLNNWLARLLQPNILVSLARAVNYPVAWEVIFSERVIVRKEIHFRGVALLSCVECKDREL
jgi:hypothetical protein